MDMYPSGTLIAGRYEVAGRPLLGGMGIVYLCMDHQEDRPVALKTFRPEFLPDRAARDRFLREGTTWVNLGRHPNIVRCYKINRVGVGREVYLALELVAHEQGRRDASLRSWLTRDQPLPVEQALLFALQIARGMGHACEQIPGFVHRDIKPENVLVGADRLSSLETNRLRVTDFGLANILSVSGVTSQVSGDPVDSGLPSSVSRPAHSRTQLTRGIVGTPLYMAPEQWLGEMLGAYTDIYALGCILYEMLTGERVVQGGSLESLQQTHCQGALDALPGSLPNNIAGLVAKCLELEPAARYSNWGELETALGKAWERITDQELPDEEAAQELSREERVAVGWSYSNMGVSYLDIGKADVARVYFERARDLGQREGERHLEGTALGNLGVAYANLGNAQRAISYFEQHLETTRKIGDRRVEGFALSNLGSAYKNLGDVRRAISYYEQALVISRVISDRRGEGVALGNLGSVYFQLGDVRRAIGYCEKRLEIAREVGDYLGEGNALSGLGVAYASLGDARRAIGFHEQALVVYREIGDRRGESAALGNLGVAYKKRGDARQAIGLYKQQLEIAREIGDRLRKGNALGNMGSAYADLGDARRAIVYFEQALVIGEEVGDRMGIANDFFNMALLHRQEGDLQKAISMAKEAARIFTQIEHTQYAQQAQQLIAQLQGNDGLDNSEPDPLQVAFEAFQHVGSVQEMQSIVSQYPFMIDNGFIQAVEQTIAEQVRPEHKPAFQERLDWLKQIANA